MPSRVREYLPAFDELTPEFWRKFVTDLDARLTNLEETRTSWEEATERLAEVGLARINEALLPAYADIRDAADLGAILRSTSASSTVVELGVKTFLIPADKRQRFAPTAHLSVFSAADPSVVMNCTLTSYVKETGVLTLECRHFSGSGTHDDWVITPSAPMNLDHQARQDNPHQVTAEQIALGNVDNTADADKPVSSAQQAALRAKPDTAYVDAQLALKAPLAAPAFTGGLGIDSAGIPNRGTLRLGPANNQHDGGHLMLEPAGNTGKTWHIDNYREQTEELLRVSCRDNPDGSGSADGLIIHPNGHLRFPNQPCFMGYRTTRWEFLHPGAHFGICGDISVNRGGFYKGAQIDSHGHAVHVPRTGTYLFLLQLYQSEHSGVDNRLYLIHNGNRSRQGQLAIIQANTQGDRNHHQTYTATGVAHMNEGDWLSYHNENYRLHAYHDHRHTQLTVVFLG